MSSKLQPVRGTHDILPEESRRRAHIYALWRNLAQAYGFGEIQTPVFEFSEVFHRTLGDTSDVVAKETYTFTDRGGESLTLRPEFTASVVRAFLSNGQLMNELPLRFFYHGPAFRYERPQKGRMRQFHQVGVELLGAPEPQADVDVIALAYQGLQQSGLADAVTLELNSLGDAESRSAYRSALVEYFQDHRGALSEDSKLRLEKNPLRILDSKDEGDRKINANAPSMSEHFTASANEFLAEVREGLSALGIVYTLNDQLVRGLDYYNHTVFEFTTTLLGAQGTVLAGGRYDGLVATMGGPETAGVGFAAGVERLLALMEEVNYAFPAAVAPLAIVPIGEAAEAFAATLAYTLRGMGIGVELAYRGNVSKRMKRADKLSCTHALLLGEDELKSGRAQLKTLATGTQQAVDLAADAIAGAVKRGV